MVKKIKILVPLILIISLMLPLWALADKDETGSENEDIIMEAQIGFDEHYRLGGWTPIIVDIENKGQDINGKIEVVINSGRDSAISYSKPAVIAKGSKKRFVLYGQVNTIQKKFNIELKQNNKILRSLEAKSLKPMTLDKYLIGIITDDKPGLGYWWPTSAEGSIFANHNTVRVNVDEIPEKIEVMDNFTMLIINNVDTSSLTEMQKKVLNQWVNNGGIMIIGTGANASKTLSGLTPTLLEVITGETFESDFIEEVKDPQLTLIDLDITNGQKLMEHDGATIAWGIKKGRGNIFVATFDMGLEPITGWKENKAFWENILINNLDHETISMLKDSDLGSTLHEKYGYSSSHQIREALGSIEALDLPSFSKLLIILLAYIIVVGPINYVILKKLDRREWAWFTIPALVLLFSLGIYIRGFYQKGNEIIVNAISTIDLGRGEQANIDTYAGIFIPKRGDYEISVDKDTLLTLFGEDNMDDMYNPNSMPTISHPKGVKAGVTQGTPTSITLYDANVWTMRTLILKDEKEDFGDIHGELYYEDGKIRGTIANNTPYPMEDLVVYTTMGSYERIGNVISGGKKEVNLTLSNPMAQYNNYDRLYMMLDNLYPHLNYGAGAPNQEEREKWIKRNLAEGIIMGGTKQNPVSEGYIHLLGFCDYRPDERLSINGKEPSDFQYRGVVTSTLDLSYEKDGLVSLPPGYIRGILNRELSDSVYDEGMSYHIERGRGVFDLDISPYVDLDLTKVEIYLRPMNSSINLSIYDTKGSSYVRAEDRVDIDNIRGLITIKPEAFEDFVDDKGIMRVGVTGGRDEYVTVEGPSLVIEGRKR